MDQLLEDGDSGIKDLESQPQPTEVLIPEVRQRTRLRRLRNLTILLVVAVLVIGYFTVIRKPTSPSSGAASLDGTPTPALLANTNADLVSWNNEFGEVVNPIPGPPILVKTKGWSLGDGRVSIEYNSLANGTRIDADRTVLSITGNDLSFTTLAVSYKAHEWMRTTSLLKCTTACSKFIVAHLLLPNPAVIKYLRDTFHYGDIVRPRIIDGMHVVLYFNYLQQVGYWVTPSSDLVIRKPGNDANSAGPESAQIDYQWHLPSKANEKLLSLAIPRGFKRYIPPPRPANALAPIGSLASGGPLRSAG